MMTIVVALCAVSVSLSAQAPETTISSADDGAVRDVVRRYIDGRDARDAKAVAALFTADADQLVSSGEWRQGREQVVTGSLASSTQAGGRRSIEVERVRLVSRDVAVADGRYAITGGEGGDRRLWSTFVMIREAGGWRIAAIRNMLPAPAAPAAK
ncbi:MAG: SgcJ/EcaC family oxidoreductase [Vicinamibacterales bacterium]